MRMLFTCFSSSFGLNLHLQDYTYACVMPHPFKCDVLSHIPVPTLTFQIGVLMMLVKLKKVKLYVLVIKGVLSKFSKA